MMIEFKPKNSINQGTWGILDTDTLCLEVFGKSIKGKRESHLVNQDHFHFPHKNIHKSSQIIKEGGFLFAVADGVGGSDQGDKASELAVRQVLNKYYNERINNKLGIRNALEKAVRTAHKEVRDQGRKENVTMATTFIGAVLNSQVKLGNPLLIDFACVGDSRAYIFRENQLEQISQDSWWYRDELERGESHARRAERQVAKKPRLEKSPRTIGGTANLDLKVDFFGPHSLQQGDIILLCTDGLYEPLNRITDLKQLFIKHNGDFEQLTTELLTKVDECGRLDDTTLILIRVMRIGDRPIAPAAAIVGVSQTSLTKDMLTPIPEWDDSFSTQIMKGGFQVWLLTGLVIIALLVLAGLFIITTQGPFENYVAISNVQSTTQNSLEQSRGLIDYATDTPILQNQSDTSVLVNHPTYTVTPTPTPTNTPTVTPTGTPTATPTNTLTPSSTKEALAGDCSQQLDLCPYNTPKLLEPLNGVEVGGVVTFKWETINLKRDEFYDLRLYNVDGSLIKGSPFPIKGGEYIYTLDSTSCGQLRWSIQISFGRFTGDTGRIEVTDFLGHRSPESEKGLFNRKCVSFSTPTPKPDRD